MVPKSLPWPRPWAVQNSLEHSCCKSSPMMSVRQAVQHAYKAARKKDASLLIRGKFSESSEGVRLPRGGDDQWAWDRLLPLQGTQYPHTENPPQLLKKIQNSPPLTPPPEKRKKCRTGAKTTRKVQFSHLFSCNFSHFGGQEGSGEVFLHFFGNSLGIFGLGALCTL